ncbi:hypothetical protein WDW86_21440 [Bdellovibrionota bacterium FG-2]
MKTALILEILGLLLAASLAALPLSAVEFESRSDALFFGDYRRLHQTGFSTLDSTFDGWCVVGSQLRARESGFQLEVRPEIRGLRSPGASVPLADAARLTVIAPSRFMNLDFKFFSNTNNYWIGDFEKLNASYAEKTFEIYAGRKPLSLGVLKVLPVWNKFTRPLPNAAGPALVFSQDIAGFRTQFKNYNVQLFDLEGPTSADAVRAGEFTWYNPELEFHALFSQWWEKSVSGLAFSKDISGMTLRGESLWVHDQEFQAGLGGELALNEKWATLVEFLYLSHGVANSKDYTLSIDSRFRNLRGRAYGYAQLTHNLSAFWILTGGALINLFDRSLLFVPNLTHSLSDNSEVYFTAQLPLGTKGAELSAHTFTFPDGRAIGAPLQLAAGLKYYF